MNQNEVQSANSVPSSLTQVRITMKYTFLEYFRSRRFLILLIITLLIAALLTIVVAWRRPPSFLNSNLGFYSSWWGSAITFVIILSGIFFGGDAISGEFQNKTGYFGIPNPIRRSSVYVGKWLSAFLAATAILVVFTVITIANGVYYFGSSGVPIQFGLSLLFAWFYLAAVMGLTFFFSSLFKSSSISILVTVILLLFGFTLIQALVSDLVGIEPWFVLTYGAGIIGNILDTTYPPHSVTTTSPLGRGGRTFTTTTFYASVPQGLAIIGLYFIITGILGLVLFERKEFT
ncbi:MAG TPA: ABC transporter permease [Candidatus Bathyarchaeia archaeon]|nr:ABC transporter permease [Candidatus Bathyarchaeia archaeon]